MRELLEKHIELQRYGAVRDLDDVKVARLILLAEGDGRITRDVGINQRPVIVVEVEPGDATLTDRVIINFAGDIAGSQDPNAQAQRAELLRG